MVNQVLREIPLYSHYLADPTNDHPVVQVYFVMNFLFSTHFLSSLPDLSKKPKKIQYIRKMKIKQEL